MTESEYTSCYSSTINLQINVVGIIRFPKRILSSILLFSTCIFLRLVSYQLPLLGIELGRIILLSEHDGVEVYRRILHICQSVGQKRERERFICGRLKRSLPRSFLFFVFYLFLVLVGISYKVDLIGTGSSVFTTLSQVNLLTLLFSGKKGVSLRTLYSKVQEGNVELG